ncbi:GMC oxidoreductase [Albibacterium indicum]|uniref:GMC oxidoreductase n=1 Tax=Albibacterium indicum TaxID=2292082 RepID=UPI000E4848C8|nr:GMC family oxidoreductase [Pedobacter indicus]
MANNNSGNSFDAIVVGSGISGGWAAKEFTEKGFKTLVLERGKDVKHVKDYPTTNMAPYEFEHNLEVPYAIKKENPIVSRCYAFREDAMHFFVKDKEHPYIQEKPFDWIRGYQTGGKSLLWARQTQRWSDFDFEGPARDGFAVDWPIRYKDIAPWYSYVEKFAGISGNKDNLPQLPDGEFLPAYPLNTVEEYFKGFLHDNYSNRTVISARCAHLSEPQPIHLEQGRAKCMNRVLCQRGCPFGGYFSSNSSTIPWAEKTGNLTLINNAIAESIIVDENTGLAKGVRVIDAETKEVTEYFAKVVFVNGSAVNSVALLLNSKSKVHENGLGNENELLGRYFAFHNYSARISAQYEGDLNFSTDGRNPAGGGYIPRFRNLYKQETDFLRGYAAGFSARRNTYTDQEGIGINLKESLNNPKLGIWNVGSHMMGETIPKKESFIKLDESEKDEWGMPLIRISVDYDENDVKMKADYLDQFEEMFEKAGFINIKRNDATQAPGLDIHEMGGARMGLDPKTSVLNAFNQVHACKNVFLTDGACMTSTSTQNPSLTYMALTARAVDHAISELKKGNI